MCSFFWSFSERNTLETWSFESCWWNFKVFEFDLIHFFFWFKVSNKTSRLSKVISMGKELLDALPGPRCLFPTTWQFRQFIDVDFPWFSKVGRRFWFRFELTLFFPDLLFGGFGWCFSWSWRLEIHSQPLGEISIKHYHLQQNHQQLDSTWKLKTIDQYSQPLQTHSQPLGNILLYCNNTIIVLWYKSETVTTCYNIKAINLQIKHWSADW